MRFILIIFIFCIIIKAANSQSISVIEGEFYVKQAFKKSSTFSYTFLSKSIYKEKSNQSFFLLCGNPNCNCYNLLFFPDSLRNKYYKLVKDYQYCDDYWKYKIDRHYTISLDSNAYEARLNPIQYISQLKSNQFYKESNNDSVIFVIYKCSGEFYVYEDCQYTRFNSIEDRIVDNQYFYSGDSNIVKNVYVIPKQISWIKPISSKYRRKKKMIYLGELVIRSDQGSM